MFYVLLFVVAAIATFVAVKARAANRRSAGQQGKRNPPTLGEFRAAGVDHRVCTRCCKPIKKMNYVFMLQARPTVYCPSCWSKATSPMQPDEKLNAWWEQLTSLYDRRESVLS